MSTHDQESLEGESLEGDAALCTELRAEARALRAAAPRDLSAGIEAALAREIALAPRRSRAAWLAAAACIALAAGALLFGALSERDTDGPLVATQSSSPSPDLLAALPRTLTPEILVARLGPGFEQPLRAELDSLAADSRELAQTVLGGVPSPVRRLLGLP
jgi:hypothetical protein